MQSWVQAASNESGSNASDGWSKSIWSTPALDNGRDGDEGVQAGWKLGFGRMGGKSITESSKGRGLLDIDVHILLFPPPLMKGLPVEVLGNVVWDDGFQTKDIDPLILLHPQLDVDSSCNLGGKHPCEPVGVSGTGASIFTLDLHMGMVTGAWKVEPGHLNVASQ